MDTFAAGSIVNDLSQHFCSTQREYRHSLPLPGARAGLNFAWQTILCTLPDFGF
jgi:hypothetical protein